MPKKITITIPDDRLKVFDHEILDIEQWILEALEGRYQYTLAIMAEEAKNVLMADPAIDTMPAKPAALVSAYMARPDYKNRKKRDEDEEKERRTKAGKP